MVSVAPFFDSQCRYSSEVVSCQLVY